MDEISHLESTAAPDDKLDCETTQEANKLTHFPSFNGWRDVQGISLVHKHISDKRDYTYCKNSMVAIENLWKTKENNEAYHKITRIIFPTVVLCNTRYYGLCMMAQACLIIIAINIHVIHMYTLNRLVLIMPA